VSEKESVCEREQERECVRESKRECVCVCVRECVCVCECVCMSERERENLHSQKYVHSRPIHSFENAPDSHN
jgi:hypothetical protein